MKLYNTLRRKKETFNPIKKGHVRIYTCGPTVYDHAHIGNLRSFIFADTLKRTLATQGLFIEHVMNITDIDDKTITKAQQMHPDRKPMEALIDVTTHYRKLFIKDLDLLGIDTGNIIFINATDHISSMKKIIVDIIQSGYGYVKDDGIYFSVARYQKEGGYNYGALVGKRLGNSAHQRIDNDEYDKSEAADFALWKRSKKSEPGWDFSVGEYAIYGRPGWHIECSAISADALGQPFDIHTGGVDLIFPHHTNELAQSKAATGKDLANFFIHSEHLMVDGKKMAKSDKNFHTLGDITSDAYNPMAFRLLILQSHYRSQQNFTQESLDAAANLLHSIYAWVDLKHQMEGSDSAKLHIELAAAMEDDLNTPKALRILSQMTADPPTQDTINKLDDYFGLGLAARPDITPEQKKQILSRESMRSKKDFAASDKIREKLLDEGIGIEDTENGTRWYRI